VESVATVSSVSSSSSSTIDGGSLALADSRTWNVIELQLENRIYIKLVKPDCD